MSRLVPFAELLAHLRAAGVAIGIDDHLLLERLVERYDGSDPEELREAIAALLSCSEADAARIRAEFDALYLPRPKPAAAAPPPWRRIATALRRRAGIALRVGGLAVALAAVVLVFRGKPGSGSGPGSGSESGSGSDFGSGLGSGSGSDPGSGSGSADRDRPPPPPPPLPSSPPPSDCRPSRPPADPLRSALPWIGLGLLGTSAGLFAALWIRRRRRWAHKARKRRLERLPGPRGYKIAPGPELPRALLDDLAILLTARTETRNLDVPRTVERTVRAGLAPVFAYRTLRRRRPVAIAIDREPEMRPYRSAATELARGLEDRGVLVERPAGLAEPTLPDAVVIVVSTGAAFHDPDARPPAWILDRAEHHQLVWITPIDDARQWPPTLRTARIPMFPFSRAGLVAAARFLGGEDPVPPTAPSLRWEDVERLRAMLAVSLQRTPELAERLRRKFLPHAPQSIHAAVGDEPLPDAERAAAWLAQVEPGLDVRVRRFLLELLAAAEPAKGSAGHLRWRRDRALLMAGVPERGGEARGELADLAAGPLGDAVPSGPRRLEKMAGDPPAAPWPRAVLGCLALALAGGAALLATALRAPPSHDDTVLVLEVENAGPAGPALPALPVLRRLHVVPPVPWGFDLYDSGKKVGRIDGPIVIPQGAHCYQIWESVSDGRFWGSPPLYVDAGPGELVINFRSPLEGPLADQEYKARPADVATAPARTGKSGEALKLPPGRWTATASRPEHADWSETAAIRSNQVTVIDAELSTDYGQITLRLPEGMQASGLLIDGSPWDGQIVRRRPGTLRLSSADPYYEIDQAIEIDRGKTKAAQVTARVVGVVRFQIDPDDARKTFEILEAPGFTIAGAEVRGVGDGTVKLRARGYNDQLVAISAVPRRTTTKPVRFTAIPLTRSIDVTIDRQPARVAIQVSHRESRTQKTIKPGQAVTLPAGDWTIAADTELGKVTRTVAVTPDTPARISIDVVTSAIRLGPLPPGVTRQDVLVNQRPLQQYPTIRALSGTSLSITLDTRYYSFRESIVAGEKVQFVNFPSAPQLGVVVVSAPAGSTVYSQPPALVLAGGVTPKAGSRDQATPPPDEFSVEAESRPQRYVLRLPPGPATVTATNGSRSKTESVTVVAGQDVPLQIVLPGEPKTAPKPGPVKPPTAD